MANLPDLIWLGMGALRLKIQNFFDARFRENMVAAADAFLKA
jgi:hypothetical protein